MQTEDMYPSSPKPEAEDKDEGPETGILPLSMFPDGVQPGYKCSLEVVAVMDDEVEVKKGEHKKDDDEVSEDPVGDMVKNEAQT